jgi:Tfp pilus assembly protein PilN
MSQSSIPGLVLGGEPRVELLPPEVGWREKARGARRISVLLIVVALVLVACGYAVAGIQNTAAQSALTTSRNRELALATEQQKYAKSTAAINQVQDITTARAQAASTEVLWGHIMDEVTSRLPEGAALESFTLKGRSPWEAALQPVEPLRGPRVATVTLGVVPSSVDATALSRALSTIPGYSDATVDALTNDGQDHTTITFDIDSTTLSGRFQTKGDTK